MQFNRKKGNETKTMRNSLTTEKKLVFVSLFLMNLITCTCCWYILCYFECALHSQVTTTPYSWLNFFFLFSHRKKTTESMNAVKQFRFDYILICLFVSVRLPNIGTFTTSMRELVVLIGIFHFIVHLTYTQKPFKIDLLNSFFNFTEKKRKNSCLFDATWKMLRLHRSHEHWNAKSYDWATHKISTKRTYSRSTCGATSKSPIFFYVCFSIILLYFRLFWPL